MTNAQHFMTGWISAAPGVAVLDIATGLPIHYRPTAGAGSASRNKVCSSSQAGSLANHTALVPACSEP